MGAQLVVIAGPNRGMAIPLIEGKPLQIGRGQQSDVGLKDLYVSRLHCRVLLKGDRLIVTDLNSAAGTYVNNQPISERSLRHGEFLQIGETHLSLRLSSPTFLDEATIAPPLAAESAAPTTRRSQDANPEITLDPPGRPRSATPTPVLSSERLAELTGETLAHYQVGPLLGRGQSGVVFRAVDMAKRRTVALKVLWPEFTHDDAEIRRFVRSMKTALPLRHPNLVTVYGAGKKGAYCYIAMRYVGGESVSAMMSRSGGGRVEWPTALTIGTQLARALSFAHARKIIHRNITPPNVLIRTADRRALLSDLFLAKAMEGGLAEHLTRPGEVLGDIRYMAPERLLGMSHVDHRSDMYSLGALLYTLLAGRPPFDGTSPPELIVMVQTEKPADVKQLQPAVPDGLSAIVQRLLAKRPEDRYQETVKLLHDLERLAKSLGVPV
jgi:serine/threonine protein kinase